MKKISIYISKSSRNNEAKSKIKKDRIKIINYIFILLIFVCSFSVECNKRRNEIVDSYIILKTNITGKIQILKNDYLNYIHELKINNVVIEERNSEYNLDESMSTINITFTNIPSSLSKMFFGCSNITEIDLSNFDTSSVENMSYMFSNCNYLNKINLSNIVTTNLKHMNSMLLGCLSLSSLDLSSFNTSKVNYMGYLFNYCSSLHSLDLSNFDTSNVINMESMFQSCSGLIYLDISNFTINNATNIDNFFSLCTKLEYINLKYAISEESNINYNIFNSIKQNFIVCSDNIELENIFPNKIIIYGLSDSNYLLEDEQTKYYTKDSNIYNKYLCEIYKENFNQRFKDSYNNNLNDDCNELLKDYCVFNYNNNIQSNIFYCYENEVLNNENNRLMDVPNQCIDICEKESLFPIESTNILTDKTAKSEIKTEIITELNTILSDKTNKIETKADIINNAIEELINDKKIVEEELTIVLTSTKNQKNNENINNITMNLGQCEDILKNDYNISRQDSLYILQIISEEEGMKIPKLEYEIYYPLNNNNKLTKLNLTSCKGSKLEISIAVKINDIIEKYNPKSDYYNNICSKATSSSGTDLPMEVRRNEFVDNNMSLCEENCDLIEYEQTKEKVKCSCDIKLSIPDNYDIKFNKKDFFKSFIDINNIMNINIMKCYKTVLKFKSLISNYGCIIISSTSVLYFFTLLFFPTVAYIKLVKTIYKIHNALKSDETRIKKIQLMETDKEANKTKNKSTKKIKQKEKKDKTKKEQIKFSNLATENNHDNSKNRLSNIKNGIKLDNDLIKIEILKKKDFELNALDYNEAIKLDHRNYCEYYISLLKYNHPIMFAFSPYNDYNSRIIKILLFFFSFCSDLTINALFFSDETMNKIYEDNGKFNFLYQLPQILYSTLISKFIDTLIRNFALSQDKIVEFKQEKGQKDVTSKLLKLLRTLKNKFILFFVSIFVILVFFWYYITYFCGIYTNTQKHLIKDSLVSLLTSLIILFLLDLIPGIFRIASLNVEKPTRKCLYSFSTFVENLLG